VNTKSGAHRVFDVTDPTFCPGKLLFMKSLFARADELRVGDEIVLPDLGGGYEHLEVLRAPAPCDPPPFMTDKGRPHVGMLVKYDGQGKPVEQTFYADLRVLVSYRAPTEVQRLRAATEAQADDLEEVGEHATQAEFITYLEKRERLLGRLEAFDQVLRLTGQAASSQAGASGAA